MPGSSEAIKHLRHDLRTPLNQMIGYSEMLIESVTERDRKASCRERVSSPV